MSENYKFLDPDGMYFVTLTTVYWIDLFTRKELKHLIVDSLNYCHKNKGLIIHAWVLMPSHLHLIISTKGEKLEFIIRDFKKFTSKEIVKTLDIINESRKDWLLNAFIKAGKNLKRIKNNKVWQDGNHPILLDTNQMQDERLDYTHNNPVEDEIVDEAEHYLYSSARDYTGRKGLIEIDFIE